MRNATRTSRTKWILGTALIAVLGGAVPGCWKPPAYPYGSYCASPANGGEYCVEGWQHPADAWQLAANHGPEPIQMWAKWPSEVPLDDLIASQNKLGAWFRDISDVNLYVRDQKRSAESYRASMGGNQIILLQQAAERQSHLLAAHADPIAAFKAELTSKAADEKGALVAEVAADKQSMGEVQALLDKAQTDAAPLAAGYAALVTQFTTYRATEAAETAAYVTLSEQASAASLADLTAVEQAVVAAAQGASSQPVDLTMAAMTLAAQIQVFETSTQKALTPHEDFMSTHGAAMPDMTSAALRSIHAMLGYVQQRVARSDATATTLIAGIAMREKALQMLASPPPPPPATDVIAAVQMRRAMVDAARAKVEARRAQRTPFNTDQAVRGTEAP